MPSGGLIVQVGAGPVPGGVGAVFSGGAIPANTQVLFSNGTYATGDSGLTRGTAGSSTSLVLDANTDNTFTTGYGMMGLVPSGTSTNFYIAQASLFNTTNYALKQGPSGITILNGAQVNVSVSASTKLILATGATFQTGCPVTVSDTTASTTTTGALVVGNGTAATTVTFGAGNGNVGGTLALGGSCFTVNRYVATGSVTTADTTGRCSMWRSGGTIGTAGDMVFQSDLAVNGNMVFRNGITTPTTSAIITSGGGIHGTVASVATAAATTTLAITSAQTQIFTGATTQTVQLPAANLLGAGIGVRYTIVNRSTGAVTLTRAGADTINAAATTFVVNTLTAVDIYSDGVSAWYTM